MVEHEMNLGHHCNIYKTTSVLQKHLPMLLYPDQTMWCSNFLELKFSLLSDITREIDSYVNTDRSAKLSVQADSSRTIEKLINK